MSSGQSYEVDLTRTARRALAESLPLDVAIGMGDFLTGPLADNPHRVGKELDVPYHGVYSARVMREWRVLYVIDDTRRRASPSTFATRFAPPSAAELDRSLRLIRRKVSAGETCGAADPEPRAPGARRADGWTRQP